MAMRLTVPELQMVLDDLRKVEESGLNVRQIEVARHTVLLKRIEGREGMSYQIVGINYFTEAQMAHPSNIR